ncbi:MAG: isoprenylcysteine carboxylmethyltransferase family protein [Acidobacteriota bacterium]|jgi:protein-S-isoprenylcysteine O-methyltransferase Ste14
MHDFLEYTLKFAWLALVLYWLWSARHAKSHMQRQNFTVRVAAYWLPFLVAVGLLGPGHWYGDTFLHHRFLPKSLWIQGLGVALVIAGVALACRARYFLGRNWSMSVELKQKHELIQSGPYSVVRHPIYTGLLIGFAGTAVAMAEWRGLISVAIFTTFIVFKLRVEERWLSELFGPEYSQYMDRIKALVPGLF